MARVLVVDDAAFMRKMVSDALVKGGHEVVGMPPGSVVELNQAADEPIDLYVNGTRFATGRLMVVDGTDWAVRIETVLEPSNTSTEDQLEVARWPESW